jgi:hypothetical protein
MLSLTRRECELGGDHSGKTKEKNGEVTKYLTFELHELELDSLELNAFLCEPHAFNSLYNNGPDGITPFLKCFKALELDASIEGAYLALYWGLDDTTMVFTECKLSKIQLVLCDGGLTKLSCKVTTAPVLDESLPALFEKFGEKIECELRAEPPGAQQDLPLNRHGEGEQSATRKPGRKRRNEAAVAH